MPTNTEDREAVVPDAAARRLSNQVTRAYRGTYGARTGLRTLVRSVSVQMLRAGSPPEAVARALADFVLNCPAPAIVDSPSSIRVARDNVLAALTAEYAPEADAAVETGHPSATAPTRRAIASPRSSR